MRKYQKAAVVVAMLGSVSFLGAGVSQADNGYGSHNGNGYGSHKEPGVKVDTDQTNACPAYSGGKSDGLIHLLNGNNINVLGAVVNSHNAVTDCDNAARIG
ncbi:hypothetical protein [Streptomyces flaveus]|uniref:Secreted protein n=1 Tax=Streptomyces flaveus TaxID=66370 RepID=A0A917V6S8_9ACTN|nr:hypothetical protein [Streptomyces flaveus]GGK46981.1 hypothetical protein GCM10010094_03700 [Streptomyces flaveus]